MNVLTSLPVVLKAGTALLVLAAAGAVFLSGRFSLQLKQKYWSGEKVSAIDNGRARTRILMLRVGAGICVAVAAIAWSPRTRCWLIRTPEIFLGSELQKWRRPGSRNPGLHGAVWQD